MNTDTIERFIFEEANREAREGTTCCTKDIIVKTFNGNHRFCCTRPEGHEGLHVANGFNRVCVVWAEELSMQRARQ